MPKIDRIYNKLLRTILRDGFEYNDPTRDNVAMIQIPHYSFCVDVSQGFPLLSAKKIPYKMVLKELLWMLSGSRSIVELQEQGVHIWDDDTRNFKNGMFGTDAGRIYGPQWRSWSPSILTSDETTIDQIGNLITALKETPFNRRLLVSAWNPAELNLMCLPPCHWSFEVLPYYDEFQNIVFDLKWHQRSVDTFLGLPFDIASYAFLGLMLEKVTSYEFKNLRADLSNVHIYGPHLDAVHELLSRSYIFKRTPVVTLSNKKDIDDFNLEDFQVINYKPEPAIKAPLITQTTK